MSTLTLKLASRLFRRESQGPSFAGLPGTAELEAELARVTRADRRRGVVLTTLLTLLAVAAGAVLVASLALPVLAIRGSSMTPLLHEGDVVVAVRGSSYHTGDVIAFYHNNQILVKRVIAQAGQWVDIAPDGTVSVDGQVLDEPYVEEPALGTCEITLPYQVPEGRVFVMGDHRSTSVDSRSSQVGCVAGEDVVGRILFRVWPPSGLGAL